MFIWFYIVESITFKLNHIIQPMNLKLQMQWVLIYTLKVKADSY